MITSLINNLALLLSLSICHIFILRRWPKRSRSHNILAGILFGFICIAGMMNPFNLVEGVFFDGRSIVASIVSFFYGPLTAVVLATIGSAYRISVGGNGALCGVGVITTSAFLGVVFHYWRQKDPAVVQPGFLYFFGILVHLSMMAWMLTIPISTHDYLSVAIPVMLLFPVGETLLGLFLIDQEKSVAAVKALEESEKRFRGVVENIPVGIAINTEVGDVEYFNKAFTQITGYTIQDVPTLDAWWPKAYPDPDKRARFQAFWLSVTTKAKDENQPIPASEYTIACKDGTVKSVMVQGLFTGGKFYTVFHDVTELEVMRRTLDNERRFLETVLETIDNGVIACNLDGIYTLFNRAAREMHEVPSSPAGQNDWVKKYVLYQADGVTPLEKDAVPLFRALNGEYVKNEEFVIRSSQGKECIVKASGKPLSDHDGQQIGAMVSLHDITLQKKTEEENRQLEEKFLQSQKMEAIGKLAGGIAHDFNNLLMAIKGYGELALLSIGPDNSVRQDIEEIIKAGDRAAALTHQLLAFSRKQILQPVNVNINDLVLNTDRMLRRLIGEDIELEIILDEHLGTAFLDPHQVEQIILNLVVNARDAMPQGGTLTIETSNVFLDDDYARAHTEVQPGMHVMLAISDTGCGIDRTIFNQIFDPFFTTKMKGKGTGLGLSTVYGIVKQSKGSIWVYSEPGSGTSFKIYFPCVPGPASTIGETKPLESEIHGNEMILLVEDEDTLRQMISRVLEEHGYKVIPAGFGEEALELCEQYGSCIQLLLTDVVMPKMSGRILADKITARYPSIRVLYMSGYTENAIVHHGVLDEGVHFIQKPVVPMKLLQKIRLVLSC